MCVCVCVYVCVCVCACVCACVRVCVCVCGLIPSCLLELSPINEGVVHCLYCPPGILLLIYSWSHIHRHWNFGGKGGEDGRQDGGRKCTAYRHSTVCRPRAFFVWCVEVGGELRLTASCLGRRWQRCSWCQLQQLSGGHGRKWVWPSSLNSAHAHHPVSVCVSDKRNHLNSMPHIQ